MMEELKNIKEAAVRMALHCGKIQMESFRTQNIGIGTKSNVYDVVTKVDKACEDYLLTEIARLYPTHSVLGEETGQHLHAPTLSWAKRQVSICMLTATGHGWWTLLTARTAIPRDCQSSASA